MTRKTFNCSRCAFLAAILVINFCFNGSQGLMFKSEDNVFIMSMNTRKGKLGTLRIRNEGSSKVEYFLLDPTPLLDINANTGTLTLLTDVGEEVVTELNNTRIRIGAALEDGSEMARTTVVIIIIPRGYGNKFINQILQYVKIAVTTNHILDTKAGITEKISSSVLIRFLRQNSRDISEKKQSMAQMKIEKAIELTKRKIIKIFERQFDDAIVYSLFRVKDLFSENIFNEIETDAECNEQNVVDPATCSPNSVFRTFDGTCNNIREPNWGAADTAFVRILRALYYDAEGLNEPIGYPNQPNAPDVPSPFEVSRDFIKDEVASASSSSSTLTHVVMQFGQFLDHDLDLALDSEGSDHCHDVSCDGSESDFEAPCYPILPLSDQDNCIRVIRSAAVCQREGYLKRRQQINANTAFVDASQIYGSTKDLADFLRQSQPNDQGLLRSSEGLDGEILPIDRSEDVTEQLCADVGECFIAGDVRSNEQKALVSFHSLFLREHNRIARKLKIINNNWDGERVYQETRKIIGAVFQKITYYDYLPVILGPEPLPKYAGYNSSVNPGVSNSFATAAYRFGHSTIRPEFEQLNNEFESIAPAINLRFMFFNNTFVQQTGIEPLLFGLIGNFSEGVDRTLSSGIIKHLFERPNSPGQNLAALNIQRSRDHGIPGYNEFRKLFRLTDAMTFNDTKNEITDSENREILKRLYNDNPNLAELWVAGLAESPVAGGSVGPTFKFVIAEQMGRTRDGDRFFYEEKNVFSKNRLSEIKKASLSRIYCDNLRIISIQKNAFKAPTPLEPRIECSGIPGIDLCQWKECVHGVPFIKEKKCACLCDLLWGGERCDIGNRVLARWSNNLYYAGKVDDVSSSTFKILFDDGDKITHSIGDNSAVIDDKCPDEMKAGQHVIGTWKGGHKYYIGFVKEITSSGKFAVRFDDNGEDLYNKCDLRIFPEHVSSYELGARVFARWTNGLFYRGFVTKATDSKVFINFDDGDTIWLNKNDKTSVILDKLPQPKSILPGQRVIGYWPNRVRFYPGTVISRSSTTYFVRYDDGDERHNKIYDIRTIPKFGRKRETLSDFWDYK